MRKILGGNRPDITPAQIIAGVPVLAALLHAFGVYSLTPEQQDALTNTVQWAFVLVGADAVLRVGRAHADAKVKEAGLYVSGAPSAGPPDAIHPVERTLTPEEIAAELGRDDASDEPRKDGLPTDAEEGLFPAPEPD